MSISKWCAVTRKADANVKPNSIAVLVAIVLAATATTSFQYNPVARTPKWKFWLRRGGLVL